MDNSSNLIKYKRLAPVYDLLFGKMYKNARSKVFDSLAFKEGDRVLIMGVGTGEDFRYIPSCCKCVGIDISDPMLEKAREKAGNRNIELLNMNAENTEFPAGSFDKVILNLILSVAGNPQMVISEANRVMADDGSILVFDKFVKKDERISWARRVANKGTTLIGTDINRCFEDIINGSPLAIVKDERSYLRGMYRIILLKKRSDGS